MGGSIRPNSARARTVSREHKLVKVTMVVRCEHDRQSYWQGTQTARCIRSTTNVSRVPSAIMSVPLYPRAFAANGIPQNLGKATFVNEPDQATFDVCERRISSTFGSLRNSPPTASSAAVSVCRAPGHCRFRKKRENKKKTAVALHRPG